MHFLLTGTATENTEFESMRFVLGLSRGATGGIQQLKEWSAMQELRDFVDLSTQLQLSLKEMVGEGILGGNSRVLRI